MMGFAVEPGDQGNTDMDMGKPEGFYDVNLVEKAVQALYLRQDTGIQMACRRAVSTHISAIEGPPSSPGSRGLI